MLAYQLLFEDLQTSCETVHSTRLQATLEVAAALQKSKSLTQASMGRKLPGNTNIKHKIKKVDRLEGNALLHNELECLYSGLSSFVFKYLTIEEHMPLIVDLCYIKDGHDIQMLSAEVALKGRTIPIYREVFGKKDLKGRAEQFLSNLSECIPSTQNVVVIMDAAFGEEWLGVIENLGWNWLLRMRGKRQIKLKQESEWLEAGELMPLITGRAKSHNDAHILKQYNHPCRVITKCGNSIKKRKKPTILPRNYNSANGGYSRKKKEPMILATNLPSSYNSTKILNFYKKRMQIEESFRDVKSPQYGLSARFVRTKCIYRWGVKMLLAAIVQIVAWVVGVIGHSLDYQRKFQANTVRDKKVFSYFFLGQLIIEHDMLDELKIDYEKLPEIIDKELARKW